MTSSRKLYRSASFSCSRWLPRRATITGTRSSTTASLPDSYFYSSASASAPSAIEEKNGKLPVETRISITPPNALRITWQSRARGAWKAELKLVDFGNRVPGLCGNTLSLWRYAPEAIAAADLSLIISSNARQGLQLAEFPGSFSDSIPLGKFTGDLPPGKWVRVQIRDAAMLEKLDAVTKQ